MIIKFSKIYIFLAAVLFLILFPFPEVHSDPVLTDYVNMPVTLQGGNKPNIVIFLDNSRTMKAPIQSTKYYKDNNSSPFVDTPLNYGGGYFSDNDPALTSPIADLSTIGSDDVFKLTYDSNHDPAFYLVCANIDNNDDDGDNEDDDDSCYINGSLNPDGNIVPYRVCTDSEKADPDTYTCDSNGILLNPAGGPYTNDETDLYKKLIAWGSDGDYYYGNYLRYLPPNRFRSGLKVLLGEENIGGGGTDVDRNGTIELETDAVLNKFDNRARFLNTTFGGGGIQVVASFNSSFSSYKNTMSNWDAANEDCKIAEALYRIGLEYEKTGSGTAWRQGNTYFPCRKSFVIFITDGSNNNKDGDSDLKGDTLQAMIDKIGGTGDNDKDGPDGREPPEDPDNPLTMNVLEPDYLDDVAMHYYTTDLHQTDALPGIQNVGVYVVGFGVGTRSDDATVFATPYDEFESFAGNSDRLLRDTATNSGGKYYMATSSEKLAKDIENAINEIMKQAGSGTAVSVLATSGKGEGAAYQAIFLPSKEDDSGRAISWIGYLQAYWVDSLGNMRQDDGAVTGKLVTSDDSIIQFIYDINDGTVVRVMDGDAEDCTNLESGCIRFNETIPIWEAGKMLAERANPRNIYTFVDDNEDGVVDAGEFLTFETANANTLRPYLRAANDGDCADIECEAEKIITYIRGENDYPGEPYRNRTIDIDEDPLVEDLRIWSFGDIVNSSPVAVSAPTERYDKLYGDSTYKIFYEKYKDRETVIYVGANDGMLHAFTGGKFDPVNLEFDYLAGDVPNGSHEPPGTELWAYIPYDLLPHLKWLTDPNYDHIYYVDLKPKVTDAQIFECDADHVGSNGLSGTDERCWGTILIGGMRFGGGQIDVKGDFDYSGDSAGDTIKTFKSSFFALDITNPANPPRLIGRFNDDNNNLGFTTSRPAVIKVGSKWFTIFGSGPDNTYDYNFTDQVAADDSGIPDYNAEYAVTGKNYNNIDTKSRIFVIDLKTGQLEKTFVNPEGPLQSEKTFMGDPIVVDLDFNEAEANPAKPVAWNGAWWNDEVVYIGETYKAGGAYPWSGQMFRIILNDGSSPSQDSDDPASWHINSVIAPDNPIIAAPAAAMDSKGNPWLYFGTGRLFSVADKNISPPATQEFFGIKEKSVCWDKTTSIMSRADADCVVQHGDLFNSTYVVVFSDNGAIGMGDRNTSVTKDDGTDIASFDALETYILEHKDGWRIDLTESGERSVTKPGVIGGLVFATTIAIEGDDTCGQAGEGFLYSLYFATGTAFKEVTIAEGSGGGGIHTNFDDHQVWKKMSLGAGAPAGVAVHIGEQDAANDSGTGGTVFIQDSTGKITRVNMTTAFNLKNRVIYWQEVN